MNKKLFSIVAAASMIATSAFARTDTWYVSAHGGADFPTKSKAKDVAIETKFKTGYSIGAAVGHSFDEFRFELEAAYRNAKAKEVDASRDVSGSFGIFSLMGNVYYDLPVMDQVDLYFGAGLGWANVSANVKENTAPAEIDSSSSVMAYQLMFGPAWNINDQWTVSLGYRFFGYTNPKLKYNGTKEKFKNNYVNSVELAVRCTF
jgi:opacity protein-like surface antigen